MKSKAYRLPKNVLPRRYDVKLAAQLGQDEFSGRVAITVDILSQTDTIEIHARGLELSDIQFNTQEGVIIGDVRLEPEREFAVLSFSSPLPAGEGRLIISFNGAIAKDMRGLYLAKDGSEELLCTQCEATDARAIFPCFDEPEFKAQFAYQITTSPDALVLTNSPLLSVTESDDQKVWTFQATKPMSSYLVALVIGNIASTPEETINGIPIRVWAMSGKERTGEFAHNYIKRLLPWFEEYFGLPYHFDKFDQVGVPGFAAGAMENSGLVLFRQALLLMDPKTVSWLQEKSIAHVIAHEFAHMWFGDLVTMKWWDDIWLNEAFAEWIAYKAVDNLSPDYGIWDDLQPSRNYAQSIDALENTHSIYNPVETPEEVLDMIDAITYVKGASVLRMLENFLGDVIFRSGIQSYIREFAERNAAGDDLWHHLQAASNEPVVEIMKSWILQPGHPLVTVKLNSQKNKMTLSFQQQRFYSNPSVKQKQDQIWKIPLVIRFADIAGSHTQRFLLEEPQSSLQLDVQGDLHWCYTNAEEIGFYRQRLGQDALHALLANLDQLTPSERMGLLADQWALTRSADQRITTFLDVIPAMVDLDDQHILREVIRRLHELEDYLEETNDEQALQSFRTWIGEMFRKKLEALGYKPQEGESQDRAQQRAAMVNALTTLARDPIAIEQARQWAAREAEDPAAVDPNLAPVFIQATAQFGDENTFLQFISIFQERKSSGATPQETDRYLNSFPFFQPAKIVEKVLKMIETDTLPQESIGPTLRSMLQRRHAQVPAWEFIKSHWETIPSLGMTWIEGLVASASNLPVEWRADFVEFMDNHLEGRAQMTYARALENMDQLAEFKARTREDLLNWFHTRETVP